MSSRSRERRAPPAAVAVACALAAAVALGACQREQRRFTEVAPASGLPDRLRLSGFNPGDRKPPIELRNPYESNAWAVSEGKRLYTAMNCVGCHAHGGGGIGPALIDDVWIYGNQPAEIYTSIVGGRENGMPAFRGKLTDVQVWQLVAYVRSMSGALRKDVRSTRSDHMNVRPSEQAGLPKSPRPPQ